MLETLHRFRRSGVPIYGMHRGSVGFLMNPYPPDGLLERLAAAQPVVLHPLEMMARDEDGRRHRALAFNEVSLLRESRQAAKLRIIVDGVVRLDELMADGDPRRDAGRQHRLQSVGARADHPARRRHSGADPDQRVPAAALARRAVAARRAGAHRRARNRQAAGQRRRRLHRGARRRLGRDRAKTATSR